jgi:hypothetical protein
MWHAAHESSRVGGTALAAFRTFRPKLLAQLERPQPRPAGEIVILDPQHRNNLGKRVVEYDRPQTVRLRVLLEDYTDTYGRTERRLAAYELDDRGEPGQRLGYLPKDAPRQEGSYIANLHRPVNRREERGRIEGILTPLRVYQEN